MVSIEDQIPPRPRRRDAAISVFSASAWSCCLARPLLFWARYPRAVAKTKTKTKTKAKP